MDPVVRRPISSNPGFYDIIMAEDLQVLTLCTCSCSFCLNNFRKKLFLFLQKVDFM